MAQIERKITIKYRWWHDEVDDIPGNILEELADQAIDHIYEFMADGYTSGEMSTEIEGIYYNGFWEMTTETV